MSDTYSDPNDAYYERERLIEREYQVLCACEEKRLSNWFERMASKAERVLIRTSRVAIGLVLAFLALWAAIAAWETGSEPFARLTLLKLAGAIFAAWLAWFLGAAAFTTAFGEAPTSAEKDASMRSQAANNVYARQR